MNAYNDDTGVFSDCDFVHVKINKTEVECSCRPVHMAEIWSTGGKCMHTRFVLN
jgi:hypothetical protein